MGALEKRVGDLESAVQQRGEKITFLEGWRLSSADAFLFARSSFERGGRGCCSPTFGIIKNPRPTLPPHPDADAAGIIVFKEAREAGQGAGQDGGAG